jgi:hypothetical protein
MRAWLAGALVLLAPAGPAAAAHAQGQQRLVTIAARSRPTYDAITANRARDRIMESLKDLGVDSQYGVPLNVDPAIEGSVQPTCTPIANWAFTLGTGYQTRSRPASARPSAWRCARARPGGTATRWRSTRRRSSGRGGERRPARALVPAPAPPRLTG